MISINFDLTQSLFSPNLFTNDWGIARQILWHILTSKDGSMFVQIVILCESC